MMASTAADPELSVTMQRVSDAVDAVFGSVLATPEGASDRLYEAMRYAAIGGGKRMRPLLVVAAGRLFDVAEENALRAGVAIECLHVQSLIHDDLPCMDDDDLRRGRPTVHRKFDEATAVLAGDALLTLAFELLARANHIDPLARIELVASLATAAGGPGMASGQMLDMGWLPQPADAQTITKLQQLKTGAVIAWCVDAAAIMGAARPAERAALARYAQCISLAFQIADDLLDLEGDEAVVGKRLRKDAEQGKETLVESLGRESARNYAAALTERAINSLNPFGPSADLLRHIANFCIARKY